jgi:hypothetical protein
MCAFEEAFFRLAVVFELYTLAAPGAPMNERNLDARIED